MNIYAERMNKHIEKIPSEAMEALLHHDWPGNIRELQNFVERSVILTTGSVLDPPVSELVARRSFSRPTTLEDCERDHILKTVQEANWVIGGPVMVRPRASGCVVHTLCTACGLAIANGRSSPASTRDRKTPA